MLRISSSRKSYTGWVDERDTLSFQPSWCCRCDGLVRKDGQFIAQGKPADNQRPIVCICSPYQPTVTAFWPLCRFLQGLSEPRRANVADLEAMTALFNTRDVSFSEIKPLNPFGVAVLAFRDPVNTQVELAAPLG
jgi:hypothetical protein